MREEVSVERLIKRFTDMGIREAFVQSGDQTDLTTQLIGVVTKLAMDQDVEEKTDEWEFDQ